MIISGNTLYGTAYFGGNADNGTIFAINTNGNGFTNLYSFSAESNSPPYGNRDGANPFDDLILAGNTLYGTAYYGGSSGNGTVFAINTDGTGFTNLHSFSALSALYTQGGINSDGAFPNGSLLLSSNTLYGTTDYGGSGDSGTIFAINTNGESFTVLYSFTAIARLNGDTNSDGGYPNGSLILSSNGFIWVCFRHWKSRRI